VRTFSAVFWWLEKDVTSSQLVLNFFMINKIKSKTGFYHTLCADLRAARVQRVGPLAMVGYLFVRPGWLAVFLYRLSAACIHKGIVGKIVGKIFWRLNVFVNACDINPGASIGEGLIIHHPIGIVVGPAIIGKNVTILQHVTLGLRRASDDADSPINYPNIGDNATIYAGAVVAGNIKIGENASIGANAVVIDDVPANSTVVGVPARVIKTS
jgi:serine O-acetyltransferase